MDARTQAFQRDRTISKGDQVIIITFHRSHDAVRRYSKAFTMPRVRHVRPPENHPPSITFRYFALRKLAGMNGTAGRGRRIMTSTGGRQRSSDHMPLARDDEDYEVYRTAGEKYKASSPPRGSPRPQQPCGRHHAIEKSAIQADILRRTDPQTPERPVSEQEPDHRPGRVPAASRLPPTVPPRSAIKLVGNAEMRFSTERKYERVPRRRREAEIKPRSSATSM